MLSRDGGTRRAAAPAGAPLFARGGVAGAGAGAADGLLHDTTATTATAVAIITNGSPRAIIR